MREEGIPIIQKYHTVEEVNEHAHTPEERKKGLADVAILLIETFYNLLLNVAAQTSSTCI